jgi:hypothetical protein
MGLFNYQHRLRSVGTEEVWSFPAVLGMFVSNTVKEYEISFIHLVVGGTGYET